MGTASARPGRGFTGDLAQRLAQWLAQRLAQRLTACGARSEVLQRFRAGDSRCDGWSQPGVGDHCLPCVQLRCVLLVSHRNARMHVRVPAGRAQASPS